MLRGSTGSAVGRYKQSTTFPNGLKVTEEVKLSNGFIDILMGREVQISRNAVTVKCSRIITRANGKELSEAINQQLLVDYTRKKFPSS
ncbi:hypothetical protein Wcon_01565 [Wolbachia endosymbiont of Cylisticus convexus]|uniref:hypothetical protein n=1 Tax=Wolbachia endosymbiont of Cylisticus convexus TaxID=118728 RepID=UPI000E127954|nr:hypothetical protein [Wolbachia endosymbiont of Cylisticus convexus]RDD34359.1 hypothetical protein Wcon_01565 [Wolbachia endosymbiont of Cylisticus convexus]